MLLHNHAPFFAGLKYEMYITPRTSVRQPTRMGQSGGRHLQPVASPQSQTRKLMADVEDVIFSQVESTQTVIFFLKIHQTKHSRVNGN